MSTPLNGTVQNIPMLTVTDRQHHDDTQTHDTEHERRHDIRHGQHERDGQHAEPDHRQRPADVAADAAPSGTACTGDAADGAGDSG